MDMYRKFEVFEIALILVYLICSGITNKKQHTTQAILISWGIALGCDVFLLHGNKPEWAWFALNVPFMVFVYEKILRKYSLGIYRAMLALFVRYSGVE